MTVCSPEGYKQGVLPPLPGCRLCLPVSMPLEEKAALYSSKKSVILRGKSVILRGKKVILRGKSVILRGKPFPQMT